MRPLIRSLFLLSVAAAPLAVAAPSAPATVSATNVASARTSDGMSVERTANDTVLVRSEVESLVRTTDGLRRDVARLQQQDDVRVRVIGDLNDHPLWP